MILYIRIWHLTLNFRLEMRVIWSGSHFLKFKQNNLIQIESSSIDTYLNKHLNTTTSFEIKSGLNYNFCFQMDNIM